MRWLKRIFRIADDNYAPPINGSKYFSTLESQRLWNEASHHQQQARPVVQPKKTAPSGIQAAFLRVDPIVKEVLSDFLVAVYGRRYTVDADYQNHRWYVRPALDKGTKYADIQVELCYHESIVYFAIKAGYYDDRVYFAEGYTGDHGYKIDVETKGVSKADLIKSLSSV